MIEYLKTISSIDAASTSGSISSSLMDGNTIPELSGQPPEVTSSLVADRRIPLIQDGSQYLSPQRIKMRKYTLKKG